MRISILVILCASVLLISPGFAEPKYHFEEEYLGKPLRPISFDKPISCTAKWKVQGGYDQRISQKAEWTPYVQIDASRLDASTLWKIVLHGQTADVTVAGGSYPTIETEVWDVASKTEADLVLVHKDPQRSISTMTIDAKNGTFVHCLIGRPLDANQGTIFWGVCSNE
jgi:hypothetical protein